MVSATAVWPAPHTQTTGASDDTRTFLTRGPAGQTIIEVLPKLARALLLFGVEAFNSAHGGKTMIQTPDSTMMATRQGLYEHAMSELDRLQTENDGLRADEGVPRRRVRDGDGPRLRRLVNWGGGYYDGGTHTTRVTRSADARIILRTKTSSRHTRLYF